MQGASATAVPWSEARSLAGFGMEAPAHSINLTGSLHHFDGVSNQLAFGNTRKVAFPPPLGRSTPSDSKPYLTSRRPWLPAGSRTR